MRICTDGIVIGTDNMDESDRLVSLLSPDCGVVRAYARGARRPGNRLSGTTELLCYSRFVLFSHRDKVTVDSADGNLQFFGVRGDLEKLSLAAYLCEICKETAPVGSKAVEQTKLLLNVLHLLESGKRTPLFLKPVYELRQIALSGYMPNLVGCQQCGVYQCGAVAFDILGGVIVCTNCQPGAPGLPLSPSLLAALRHILYSEPEKLFSFSLPEDGQKALSSVTERYLITQLGRTFKTLDFYKSIVT